MPTPLDIARRRLAAATTDRQRAGCALAVALLSIPAASLSAPDVHRRLGSGSEAGGLDAPAREFSSFSSPAGQVAGGVKGTLERV